MATQGSALSHHSGFSPATSLRVQPCHITQGSALPHHSPLVIVMSKFRYGSLSRQTCSARTRGTRLAKGQRVTTTRASSSSCKAWWGRATCGGVGRLVCGVGCAVCIAWHHVVRGVVSQVVYGTVVSYGGVWCVVWWYHMAVYGMVVSYGAVWYGGIIWWCGGMVVWWFGGMVVWWHVGRYHMVVYGVVVWYGMVAW